MPVALDHAPQPNDGLLRASLSPTGATFVDDRLARDTGQKVVATLKHGRLTISGLFSADVEVLGCLRNRHIRGMQVLATPRSRLRIELSERSVDLFEGVSQQELEWVQGVIEAELEAHRIRKEAATARQTVPDRWRFPIPSFSSWPEARGLLLLTSFLVCLSALLMCLWQISLALHAIDGFPLSPELKLRLVEWVPAALLTFALSLQLAFSLCRSPADAHKSKRTNGA